ncbi:hypothetical protein, partial [Thiolapillus sp.]|uniref:hypothetical protein n=1 Tax=Thiolapillus sp. TaxID=2017437 RepID=UPI0025EE366B
VGFYSGSPHHRHSDTAARFDNAFLDYPPSSAARQPNLVASNPADIGKPRFLMMQTKVDFDQIWQCKEATR